MAVIDKDGNIFDVTPSGGWVPGAVILGDTGIGMSVRGEQFWLDKTRANQIRPHARPRYTLTPSLVFKGDTPMMAMGSPGGDNQDQTILQAFLSMVEFWDDWYPNLHAAFERPRVQTLHFYGSFWPTRPGSTSSMLKRRCQTRYTRSYVRAATTWPAAAVWHGRLRHGGHDRPGVGQPVRRAGIRAATATRWRTEEHPMAGNSVPGLRMRASLLLVLLLTGCRQSPSYDVLIRHGMLYDGSGSPPRVGDIGINGDTITTIGDLGSALGTQEIDARGLSVAPGFVNMLSWANESLIVDGRSQSDIRQGVTLEVMGEGDSMGPLNERMKAENVALQGDIKYRHRMDDSRPVPAITSSIAACRRMWRRLLARRRSGVHEIGYANRAPTSEEMARMKVLVRQAMEEGALGSAPR